MRLWCAASGSIHAISRLPDRHDNNYTITPQGTGRVNNKSRDKHLSDNKCIHSEGANAGDATHLFYSVQLEALHGEHEAGRRVDVPILACRARHRFRLGEKTAISISENDNESVAMSPTDRIVWYGSGQA